MDIRTKALEFATKAHEGQFRNNSRLPYITHPIAVAEIGEKLSKSITFGEWDLYNCIFINDHQDFFDRLYVVCILHDTVEDCDITLKDVYQEFGSEVEEAVYNLTKRKGENYLEAILRAKSNIYSRITKISDNIHNMSDLKEGTLKDKYRLSKYILEN